MTRLDPTTLPARVREAGSRIAEASEPYVDAARVRLVPVTSAVSPVGWVVLAAVVALGWAGWSQGWAEFKTAAVLLGTVLLLGLAFTFGRWNYDASIDLESRRVRIGDRVLGRVLIQNGRRRSASTRVELPVGAQVARFAVPRLGADEAHEQGFVVPTRRRAVITVGPVRSVRSDPLGLFHRQRSWTDPVELFVHPETVLLPSRATGFLKDVEGVATQNLSSSDVSFHALRDYVPGDDRRSIHWRTTARTGRLMVRQFEETMRTHLLLLLSLRTGDYADPRDFELAVSTVASLGVAATREHREVSVYTSAGALDFHSGTGLLDGLCRVELSDRAHSLLETAAHAARRVTQMSMVGIVTGSVTEPGALRGVRALLPPEVSSFAVRCQVDAPAARRSASRMVILDVGSLDDLRRGMGTL